MNERCECSHNTTGKMTWKKFQSLNGIRDFIATIVHLWPWNPYIWVEYYVHWTYRAEPTHDRSHVALIAQLVEHCTGDAKVVGSIPVQSLKYFSGHFSGHVMAAFISFHSAVYFFQLWVLNFILIEQQSFLENILATYQRGYLSNITNNTSIQINKLNWPMFFEFILMQSTSYHFYRSFTSVTLFGFSVFLFPPYIFKPLLWYFSQF